MFDSMPETRSEGQVIHGRTFSTALIIHLAVLLVIASASVFALVPPGEDPPIPSSSVIVISEIPRRGDDPNAGGHHAPAPPEKRDAPVQPVLQELVQPPPVVETQPLPDSHDVTPPPDVQPPVSSNASGGPGGGSSTDADGSGVGDGPGTQPGRPGVPWGRPDGKSLDGPKDFGDDPIVISTGVDAPVLLVRVEPIYPEMARRSGVQGEVYLEGVIGTDGRVESLRTLKSAHVLLEEAAKRAVRQWVYRPARQNGRIVKVYMTIRVEFRLN